MLDEHPQAALMYTLDLLRSFTKIRPDALPFFGAIFGPLMLKEFPADKAATTFSTLISSFSSILEVLSFSHLFKFFTQFLL